MIQRLRCLSLTIAAIFILAIGRPYCAIAQTDFVSAESRYYDSVDTLRLIAPLVEGSIFIGWVPKAEDPSHGLAYIYSLVETIPATTYMAARSFTSVRLANERYCGLRNQLTQKAKPVPKAELPKCYVFTLQDALQDRASAQDLTALQLAVTDLKRRVEKLEKHKN